MQAQIASLKAAGIAENRIHYEVFFRFACRVIAAADDLNRHLPCQVPVSKESRLQHSDLLWVSAGGFPALRSIRNSLAVSSSSSVAYCASASALPATTGP